MGFRQSAIILDRSIVTLRLARAKRSLRRSFVVFETLEVAERVKFPLFCPGASDARLRRG